MLKIIIHVTMYPLMYFSISYTHVFLSFHKHNSCSRDNGTLHLMSIPVLHEHLHFRTIAIHKKHNYGRVHFPRTGCPDILILVVIK